MTKIKTQRTLFAFAFVLFVVLFASNSFAAVRSVGSESTTITAEASKSCYQQGYRLTSCPVGKMLTDICTDSKGINYYKSCGCDSKYARTCSTGQTGVGTSCDGKFETCSCDTSTFKFDTSNCTGVNVLSGTTCKGEDGVTRFQNCLCPAGYQECASPLVGDGRSCSEISATALINKFASCSCPAIYNATCPDGASSGATSCTETNGAKKYKTADCKTAPVAPTPTDPCPYVDRHYWNTNGSYTIPTGNTYENAFRKNVTRIGGTCGFEGYGAYSTINIPAGKSYVDVVFTFWQTSTINGELNVTRNMRLANENAHAPYTITFNDKVTVNGTIPVDQFAKATFNRGLYGNHVCEYVNSAARGYWTVLSTGPCPADWYNNVDGNANNDPCPYVDRHGWNADGAHSIPTSNTFGSTVNTMVTKSGGTCGFEGYGAYSTITIPAGKSYHNVHIRFWQTSTVKGDLNVTRLLQLSNDRAVGPYPVIFENKVTVNGKIEVDDLATATFKQGLYGNHFCDYVKTDRYKGPTLLSTGACPSGWYNNGGK